MATEVKKAVKKVARKKSSPAPVRKAVKKSVKKTAAAPAKKTQGARKAVATKKVAATPNTKPKTYTGTGREKQAWRDYNEHGFVKGSDTAAIADALIAGGASREDINTNVAKVVGKNKTRSGADKNIPALVSSTIARMKTMGFTVDSHFKMVPPSKATASKNGASKRAVKKTAVRKKTSK